MNWRKAKRKKIMTVGSNTRPRGWETDVCSTRPQPYLLKNDVGCSIHCHAFLFSCPFFNSFCLFSFICLALLYLQLPQYFFTRNYFHLHDTQPNRTNFSFSNSRTFVNQLVDHWSCAMASFWDFKIICAPWIISKTVSLKVLHRSHWNFDTTLHSHTGVLIYTFYT